MTIMRITIRWWRTVLILLAFDFMYSTTATSSSFVYTKSRRHIAHMITFPSSSSSFIPLKQNMLYRTTTKLNTIESPFYPGNTNRQRISTKKSSSTVEGEGFPKQKYLWSYNNRKRIFKVVSASLFIAGTTIGGGFLALPVAVVLPLGGFPITAISLFMVWIYLLGSSLLLCDVIIHCNNNTINTRGDTLIVVGDNENVVGGSDNESVGGGIVNAAQKTMNAGSVILVLLLVLTKATLVSQLSRAGILFMTMFPNIPTTISCSEIIPQQSTNNFVWSSSSSSTNSMYRIGCTVAAMIGAVITFTQSRTTTSKVAELDTSTNVTNVNNNKRPNMFTNINSILTITFLSSALLLFHAGSSIAVWKNCFLLNGSPISSIRQSIEPQSLLQAIPTILQLLVYGEILPIVCSMLEYNKIMIQYAVCIGSFIPLVLLSGWAALGVALVPPPPSISVSSSIGAMGTTALQQPNLVIDPVSILLQKFDWNIQSRLYTLAFAAIGTTILGCYVALESIYDDVLIQKNSITDIPVTGSTNTQKTNDARFITDTRSISLRIKDRWKNLARCFSKVYIKSYAIKPLLVVVPSLLIACTSPSIFLSAIDFAGSYPVLLLYGIITPIMYIRSTTSTNTMMNYGNQNKIKKYLAYCIGCISTILISLLTWKDVRNLIN